MILLAGALRAEIIGSEPRPSALPVADVIDAWRPADEGNCARCETRTCRYGPDANPLCADCRPSRTEAGVIPIPAAQVPYHPAA